MKSNRRDFITGTTALGLLPQGRPVLPRVIRGWGSSIALSWLPIGSLPFTMG
jgi:hypothetical protein